MKGKPLSLPSPDLAESLLSLNMQIQTSHSTLNLGLTVERLLEELEERFPLTNPTEDATHPQIMYRAGQRDVVDWIHSRLSQEEL